MPFECALYISFNSLAHSWADWCLYTIDLCLNGGEKAKQPSIVHALHPSVAPVQLCLRQTDELCAGFSPMIRVLLLGHKLLSKLSVPLLVQMGGDYREQFGKDGNDRNSRAHFPTRSCGKIKMRLLSLTSRTFSHKETFPRCRYLERPVSKDTTGSICWALLSEGRRWR